MHGKKCVYSEEHRRNGAQKQNQTKQENMQQPWDDYVFRSLVYFYIEYFEHLTCGNLYQGTGAVYWIETCGLIHYCNGPTVKPSKSCQHEWLMWWAGHTWQYTRFGLEWKLYNSTTLTTPANTHGPDRAHWGRNVSCVTEISLSSLTHSVFFIESINDCYLLLFVIYYYLVLLFRFLCLLCSLGAARLFELQLNSTATYPEFWLIQSLQNYVINQCTV